jgi:hypothetical protein
LFNTTKARNLNKPTTVPNRDSDIWAVVEILEKSFGNAIKLFEETMGMKTA